MPICENECGENGHCIKPGVCECDPGWYSSDVTSQCDLLDPLVLDPNCVLGNILSCLECDYEYYLAYQRSISHPSAAALAWQGSAWSSVEKNSV